MKRSDANFTIDCLGFAGFVLLSATGVLVRYVLPPGSGRSTTVWTLDRHEWGSIHFWIAVAFLAVLACHLFLHWRWIATLLRGRPREGSGARAALGAVGLAALLALGIAPFLSPVDRSASVSGSAIPLSREAHGLDSIRGSTSLAEVEEATGVPAEHILRELGLPPGTPKDERLGRLRMAHGFSIDDVRRIVEAYPRDAAGGRRR
jgi:hypothetical protein